ncbi:hypothetical protein FMN50_11495 [Rhodobacterales bacterium]|nr:hypothetical protein FMN50_11495 [Rhodobacterales bacterium]
MHFRKILAGFAVALGLQGFPATAAEYVQLTTIPQAGLTVLAATDGQNSWCAETIDLLLVGQDPSLFTSRTETLNTAIQRLSTVLREACPTVQNIGVIGQAQDGTQLYAGVFKSSSNFAFSQMQAPYYQARPALHPNGGNLTVIEAAPSSSPQPVNAEPVANEPSGSNPILSTTDLSAKLSANRVVDGRVVAPIIPDRSVPLDFTQFGMSHRDRDVFFDAFLLHLELQHSQGLHEGRPDLNLVRKVLGDQVTSQFLRGNSFVGESEFERADNKRRLLAILNEYIERNSVRAPMKMTAVFGVELGEYDAQSGGFPLQINAFSHWGSYRIQVEHEGFYNSMAKTAFKLRTILPVSSTDARTLLELIREDALAQLPADSRSHVRDRLARTRTLYAVANYTIEALENMSSGDDLKVKLDVDSIALYSTPQFNRKLFDLMVPGEREAAVEAQAAALRAEISAATENAGENPIISAPDLFQELGHRRLYKQRVVYPVPHGTEIPRFGITERQRTNFSDRFLGQLALQTIPEAAEHRTNLPILQQVLGGTIYDQFVDGRGIRGADEFTKRDNKKRLLATLNQHLERNRITFPIRMMTVFEVRLGNYNAGSGGFPIEINQFDHWPTGHHQPRIQSGALYNSLTGETFERKTVLPLSDVDARQLLEIVRADALASAPGDDSYRRRQALETRSVYALANYTITGAGGELDRNEKPALKLDVKVASIALFSTPNLDRKLIDLMIAGDREAAEKAEAERVAQAANAAREQFDILGVRLAQSMGSAEEVLADHYGDAAKIYRRKDPAKLLDRARTAVSNMDEPPRNPDDREVVLENLAFVSQAYVPQPIEGIAYVVPAGDGGKETTTVYARPEAEELGLLFVGREIDLGKTQVDVRVIAERLIEKLGEPTSQDRRLDDEPENHSISLIWMPGVLEGEEGCLNRVARPYANMKQYGIPSALDYLTRTSEDAREAARQIESVKRSVIPDNADRNKHPMMQLGMGLWYDRTGAPWDGQSDLIRVKPEEQSRDCGVVSHAEIRSSRISQVLFDSAQLVQIQMADQAAIAEKQKELAAAEAEKAKSVGSEIKF